MQNKDGSMTNTEIAKEDVRMEPFFDNLAAVIGLADACVFAAAVIDAEFFLLTSKRRDRLDTEVQWCGKIIGSSNIWKGRGYVYW